MSDSSSSPRGAANRPTPSSGEPIVLRSPANATVRHLVRLRDNRFRRKSGQIIVDGWRENARAIAAGLETVGLYVPESLRDESARAAPGGTNESAEIQAILGDRTLLSMVTWVSDAILERIGYGDSSRGIVGTFGRPGDSLAALKLPANPLLLVLDRVEKPGNLGAVFRCADAAGVDAVLLSDCQDRFNPNSIRNSLGAVFHVPSARGDQAEIAEFLTQNSIRLLAARVESSQAHWDVRWDGPVAVILGSEADGLGGRWQPTDGRPIAGVRIPMSGQVDSLNVSVSAAVIAFEAVRQRRTSD